LDYNLGTHNNVLGLRRVPLGQRPNLALGGFGSGSGSGLGSGFGVALVFIFCLGTHSFVILFRAIPLGHLFDLTGLTLSLLLAESAFDFSLVGDDDNFLEFIEDSGTGLIS
jgi:hypothetical protein